MRQRASRVVLLLALVNGTPAGAGIVDTYECRRDLAMADRLVHGVRLRENSVQQGDFVGLCRLLRQKSSIWSKRASRWRGA
jgi:hypothetical protein